MPVNKITFKSNTPFVEQNKNEINKTETPIDKEKSHAMEKMLGLGAAAAIAIGGIYYYVKRGKAPKGGSSSIPTPTPSTSGTGEAAPAAKIFEEIKQRADGTIRRIVNKDENGRITKMTYYAKDGKTITSETKFENISGVIQNNKYVTRRTFVDGKLETETEYITSPINKTRNKTIEKIHNLENNGLKFESHYDTAGRLTHTKKYDNKTGQKVVESRHFDWKSDGNFDLTSTFYGQGKSRKVIHEYADDTVIESKFDSNGKLRHSIELDANGKIVFEKKIDKKGRETHISYENGKKQIVKHLTDKNGNSYTQHFHLDEENPLYRGINFFNLKGESIGSLKFGFDGKPQECNFRDKLGNISTLMYHNGGKKNGKLLTQADGTTCQIKYDKFGNKAEDIIQYTNGKQRIHKYRNGQLTDEILKISKGEVAFDVHYHGDFRYTTTYNSGADGLETVTYLSKKLKHESNPQVLLWTPLKETYRYSDGSERIIQKSIPNSPNSPWDEYVWNPDGELIKMNNSTFENQHDAAGNVTKIIETDKIAGKRFVYDKDFDHPIEQYHLCKNKEGKDEWIRVRLEF